MAVAIKIVLMYLPLVVVVIFSVIYLLRRCGVVTEFHCQTSQEDDDHNSPSNWTLSLRKRGNPGVATDEDLFSRAAEQNTSSYYLTSSGGGFELKQSTESTGVIATESAGVTAEGTQT